MVGGGHAAIDRLLQQDFLDIVRCEAAIRERRAYVIAFADRPDYATIADSMGMPVGSIGPTRGRCLAKLRQELAADPQWEGRVS